MGKEKQFRLIDFIHALYEGRDKFFQFAPTVGDLMTADAFSLPSSATIETGLDFLERHDVRHIPVIEAVRPAGRSTGPNVSCLIGIVSQRDLIRAFPTDSLDTLQAERNNGELQQPLQRIMTANPITLSPETPVFAGIRKLVDKKIDCLPVVVGEDRELVGIFTSSDVIRCVIHIMILQALHAYKFQSVPPVDFLNPGKRAAEACIGNALGTVADIMQKPVVMIRVDDTLADAMKLMRSHRIRHLVVVDEEKAVQGIVSDRDILRRLPPRNRPRGKLEDQSYFREDLFEVDPEDTQEILARPVSSIMDAKPEIFDPSASVVQAAQVFCNRRFRGATLMASDSGGVQGIITETDVMKAILSLSNL